MSATSIWHPSRGPFPGAAVGPIPLRARARAVRRVRHWLIASIGMACLAATAWWVTNSQAFDLRGLHVTGNVRLSSDELARVAGLTEHTNVLWLPASDLERRLQRSPWVLSARVTRTLPSTVTVSVRERAAVAILSGRPPLLVAGDGVILGPAAPSDRLPLIGVPDRPSIGSRLSPLPQLRVAEGLHPSVRALVGRIRIDASGAIVLRMRDGTRVLLGDASAIRAKGEALQGVLSWVARHAVVPRYIDLRIPAAPAVHPRSAP